MNIFYSIRQVLVSFNIMVEGVIHMIYYEIECRYCKKCFKLLEGTKKYDVYKKNRQLKQSCDDCDRKIEADSRKYLFNRD